VTEQQETLVCPLRKVGDRRFRARHYAVWIRKCARCRGKIIVSDSLKTKADAAGVRLLCENCALIENSK
jgi:hypothetical protein